MDPTQQHESDLDVPPLSDPADEAFLDYVMGLNPDSSVSQATVETVKAVWFAAWTAAVNRTGRLPGER